MLEFKIDVLSELKKNGYNTTRIRKEKIFSEGVLTDIRRGKVPTTKIDTLCKLLNKQPGSIIKYVPDGEIKQ